MNSFSKKQMLYISVQNFEKSPILRFEIEDYFSALNRRTFTDGCFESFKLEEILTDTENLKKFGFSLALGFLSPRNLKDRDGNSWALVVCKAVYKDSTKRDGILQIDEESYRENRQRRHCTSFELPTLELQKLGDDFHIKVAKTVLGCLL